MSEDVSAYMRTAVTVFCSSALCAAAVNVMVMSMNILDNYTNKYTFTLTTTATGAFADLALNDRTVCPIVYCAVDQAIESVALVKLVRNGTVETLYDYTGLTDNNLMKLLTVYRTYDCRFTYKQSGIGGLYEIELEVINK